MSVIDPLGLCPRTIQIEPDDPDVERLPKVYKGSMSSEMGSGNSGQMV